MILTANVRTRTRLSPPDFITPLSPGEECGTILIRCPTYWEHNANGGKNDTLPYPPRHIPTIGSSPPSQGKGLGLGWRNQLRNGNESVFMTL